MRFTRTVRDTESLQPATVFKCGSFRSVNVITVLLCPRQTRAMLPFLTRQLSFQLGPTLSEQHKTVAKTFEHFLSSAIFCVQNNNIVLVKYLYPTNNE